MIGIKLERRIAFGYIILRVITCKHGGPMAKCVREHGYPVTVFRGEGQSGPVEELYVVCRRRDLRRIVDLVHSIEPCAFYITEQIGEVSKIHRPFMSPVTGWRAVLKKK